VQGTSGKCLYCEVGVTSGVLVDGVGASRYRCLTHATQEGDGMAEMSYSLNLPTTFVNANKVLLDSGVSSICIIGGSAIRTEFERPDYVVIPPNTEIHFVASRKSRQRHLVQTSGIKSLLLVRVTAPNSTQNDSLERLSNVTFGTGNQQNSMAAQFSSCSSGKLQFVPASGYPGIITNGVMDLPLQASVDGLYITDIQNSLTAAVQNKLGVANLGSIFSNIMFCMPYGTLRSKTVNSKSWIAYSFMPGQYSYFNNGECIRLTHTAFQHTD